VSDINFIKWKCSKTEHFKYELMHDGEYYLTFKGIWIRKDSPFYEMQESFLLQRAIEEINQSDDTCYFIQINPYSVCIHNVDTGKDIEIFDYNDSDGNLHASSKEIDNSKESALKYIYDQETK